MIAGVSSATIPTSHATASTLPWIGLTTSSGVPMPMYRMRWSRHSHVVPVLASIDTGGSAGFASSGRSPSFGKRSGSSYRGGERRLIQAPPASKRR